MLTRREFGALTLSAVALPGLACAQTISGVRLGVQTFSFRELMRPPGGDLVEPIIGAMKACGLTECSHRKTGRSVGGLEKYATASSVIARARSTSVGRAFSCHVSR